MEESVYRPPRPPLVESGAIECHARDMTVTASADVTLADLQSELARISQWLPIDGEKSRSLGGLVSRDSTGPLRLGYGGWRDLLLGVQFVNGRGELITAGGRTVKNVAGYDLSKFMVGQHGVFGKPVTVTTRTFRRPAGSILAVHPPDAGILAGLIPASLRPQWAMLTRDDLLCGYLGDEPALEFYASALRPLGSASCVRRSLEEDVAHRQRLWRAEGEVVFRASAPPARVKEFVAASGVTEWVADPAFGVVLGTGDRAAVRKAAGDIGGTARFFRGADGALLEVFTSPEERKLIERLKFAFDPAGALSHLP